MKNPTLVQKISEIITRKNQSYDQLTQLKSENNDLNLQEAIQFIETEIYDLDSLISLSQEYVEYMMSKNYDTNKIIHWKGTIDFYTNMRTLYSQKLRIMCVKSDKMN